MLRKRQLALLGITLITRTVMKSRMKINMWAATVLLQF